MTTNEKLTEVLNDLVRINNDRIAGYEKAIHEVEDLDIDLKTIFTKMAEQSRGFRDELSTEVAKAGGEIAEGTTNSGKIYRAWMDVKAAFSGHDRQAALESCEGGEDAAQRAYREALTSDADMSPDVRQLITSQQSELKDSHDLIKKYRDLHAAVHS